MKIIIAGCGKVGATITEQLSMEGHDVAIIDSSSEVVKHLTDTYDVIGVEGNAASYLVQKEAGVEDADLLIAVTDSDEVNMLCCLIAKKAGDCSTIARIRNPIYSQEAGFIKEELGLAMSINPERAAAREMSRVLRFPSAINIETFAKGRIELIGFKIPAGCPIIGMKVMDIRKHFQSQVLICAVERGDEVSIPNGNFVLAENDAVNIVASPADVRMFFRDINIETQKIRNVMIVGGGTIAFYLTQLLLNSGMNVKIIEKDRKRCEELSELLPDAEIIHGDASNQEILIEEGIRNVDAFVSMTGLDEGNVFLSLYARDNNEQAKLITKLNKLSFEKVIDTFNLGTLIYPKYMTAENIVRYVRAMQNGMGSNVETLYRIVRNKVEAMEFIIQEDSPVSGIPLRDLKLKDNLLVTAISRGRELIYPNGDSTLEAGDRVIIVTTQKGLNDIKDILK